VDIEGFECDPEFLGGLHLVFPGIDGGHGAFDLGTGRETVVNRGFGKGFRFSA